MKNRGTELRYTINGAKFKHRYDTPSAAADRAEVLVANGIPVKVKHFPLRRER